MLIQRHKKGNLAVLTEEGSEAVLAANEVHPEGYHRLALKGVAVRPEFKRMGYGTLLYRFWALESCLNFRFVMSDMVTSENKTMRSFLESLFFEFKSEMVDKTVGHETLTVWIAEAGNLLKETPEARFQVEDNSELSVLSFYQRVSPAIRTQVEADYERARSLRWESIP